MPFTYRDKPKLADRLRGKSGEEILNELKSDLDPQERRMFFDSPSWRTRQNNSGFPRGFPFDDDRNRINIRTYLDEIAARHPEFADQLREPSWREDLVDPPYHKTEFFPQSQQSPGNEAQSRGSHQIPPEAKEPQSTLTNFGLRNTVPLGPGANLENDRHQRSMSAPPENRTGEKSKRFVTKCEIPVMNSPLQEPVQMKPELPPGKGVQEPPQQKANNAPNVRVIPIQVEGRDTPIVNSNIDTATNFGAEAFHDQSFEGRLPRDFGTYQRHSPRFAHKERTPSPTPYQYAPQFQQYAPPSSHFGPSPAPHFMPQQGFAPPHPQPFAPQQQHPQKPPAPPPTHRQDPQHFQQQQQQQHEPRPPQGEEADSKPAHPPKPEPPKDPIEKVEAIQKEVEKLTEQVKAFKGNSITDKQYLMLDELLTRQLLLLDNIETEGKENVRQARKDTIHSIQRCISLLESKVPVSENIGPGANSKENKEEQNVEASGMEVDVTEFPVEKKVQAMDVDEKGSEGVQEARQQQQQQQQQSQEELQAQQQSTQQQVVKEESKEKV